MLFLFNAVTFQVPAKVIHRFVPISAWVILLCISAGLRRVGPVETIQSRIKRYSKVLERNKVNFEE